MLQLLHTMEGSMERDTITMMWGTRFTTLVTMATSLMGLHKAPVTTMRTLMRQNGATQHLNAEVGLFLFVFYLNSLPLTFSLVYTCCKLAKSCFIDLNSVEHRCYAPTPPHYGKIHGKRYDYYDVGHTINYTCDYGYKLYGSSWSKCYYDKDSYSAKWSHPVPECRSRFITFCLISQSPLSRFFQFSTVYIYMLQTGRWWLNVALLT